MNTEPESVAHGLHLIQRPKKINGTGIGAYNATNGGYKDNKTFCSRDNTRVGASLKFNYKLVDGNWYHTGLSSKGDPIHEIWSERE